MPTHSMSFDCANNKNSRANFHRSGSLLLEEKISQGNFATHTDRRTDVLRGVRAEIEFAESSVSAPKQNYDFTYLAKAVFAL